MTRHFLRKPSNADGIRHFVPLKCVGSIIDNPTFADNFLIEYEHTGHKR